MKILITGASGLIGRKLQKDLQKLGHTIVAVDRQQWDALRSAEFPVSLLQGCEAVIHLAGFPIAEKRWSREIKSKILDSRVRGTEQLVRALSQIQLGVRPHVFISASAVGFYGDRADEELNENSKSGNDFLADVVTQWETAAGAAQDLGIRTLFMRSGVVLARGGGALAKMPPVILGSGKNYMSWIHLQDWVNFVIQALGDDKISGVYNMVSPQPVTQAFFVKALARAKKIPVVLWTPKIIFKMALGQMSEMLLASQKVKPARVLYSGFQFQFPTLEKALKDIYQDP